MNTPATLHQVESQLQWEMVDDENPAANPSPELYEMAYDFRMQDGIGEVMASIEDAMPEHFEQIQRKLKLATTVNSPEIYQELGKLIAECVYDDVLINLQRVEDDVIPMSECDQRFYHDASAA